MMNVFTTNQLWDHKNHTHNDLKCVRQMIITLDDGQAFEIADEIADGDHCLCIRQFRFLSKEQKAKMKSWQRMRKEKK